MIIVLYIKTWWRKKIPFAKSSDTLANEKYKQYKILVFLTLKMAFSLALYQKYFEKALAAPLVFP